MEYGRIIPERKKGCRNETGNGKKVGIWICLSPNNYYLNPTYLLSILLLLSESYGSAFKSILAFNYEKIALVGSGRRSEDRKSRKKVLYYLSVLWLFHFTNRSPPVYYGWCQEKIKIIAAPCSLFHIILSNLDQRLVRKKNSGKKKGCSYYYYTFHVWLVRNSHKSKRQRKKERNQKWVYYYSWLIGLVHGKEDWLQKKDRYQRRPGCRR